MLLTDNHGCADAFDRLGLGVWAGKLGDRVVHNHRFMQMQKPVLFLCCSLENCVQGDLDLIQLCDPLGEKQKVGDQISSYQRQK
jgi:hypothetical protein